MTEQKHFSYEGHIKIATPDIAIKDIKFLVPIRIDYTSDGIEQSIVGQMDYAKKELYIDGILGPIAEKIKEKTLEFLRLVVTQPEDKYVISQDVMDKVAAAEQEHRKFNQEHVGEE